MANHIRQSAQSQSQDSAQMQCSTAPSKIFSYALLLLSYVSINFSALIIQIWLDGMVVHPTQAAKKEHGILILNVPCSFCPLLQHFFYMKVNPSFRHPPESAAYIYNRYPGKSSQFYALHVIQCAAKRLTMDTDLLLYILNSLNS